MLALIALQIGLVSVSVEVSFAYSVVDFRVRYQAAGLDQMNPYLH